MRVHEEPIDLPPANDNKPELLMLQHFDGKGWLTDYPEDRRELEMLMAYYINDGFEVTYSVIR